MAGRLVNQGETLALNLLVNAESLEDVVLRLFKNDVESGLSAAQKEALTEADFTEADFTGYAAVTLVGDGGGASNEWTATPGDPGEITHAEVVFASTASQAAQQIFGWYLTRVTGGELVMYDYLNAAVTIENDGDQIRITPKLTAQDTND